MFQLGGNKSIYILSIKAFAEGDCGPNGKKYINEANTMMSRTLNGKNNMFFWYSWFSGVYLICYIRIIFCCVQIRISPFLYRSQLIHYCHRLIHRGSNLSQLRCVLLMGLITCLGGSWLLEQPGSSCMGHYFRFQWLCSRLRAPGLKYNRSDLPIWVTI